MGFKASDNVKNNIKINETLVRCVGMSAQGCCTGNWEDGEEWKDVACRDVMRDVRWQKTGRRRFSELPVKWKMTVLFTFLFSFTPSYFWNVFLFPFITGHRLFFDVWQQLIRTFEPNRKQFKYESSLLTFLPQIAHLYLNMNILYTMFISSIFQNELSLLHFYEKKKCWSCIYLVLLVSHKRLKKNTPKSLNKIKTNLQL